MLINAPSPPYFNIEQETARSTFSICACNALRCCRGRGRRRRCRRTETGKIHSRWSLRALLRCEKWALRKTEHPSNQICRETSHSRVVILHRSVEISPLDGNAVLGSFKLRL